MQIEKIPVTRSGKVDKKALPEPEFNSMKAYVAPTNDIEREILETIEYVLGEENIGMNDDFFDLGGHSILLIELISILKEQFKVNFIITDFIDGLTAADVYRKYQEIVSEEVEEEHFEIISWDDVDEEAL